MADLYYCTKCKGKKEMKDAKPETTKNGRSALRGTCSSCGSNMYTILGKGQQAAQARG